jgi:hypothetical protein
MNKHKPTQATSRAAASAAWRAKNTEHVRAYKRAYYEKKKVSAKHERATIESAIDSIARQLDRIEAALHALQNGPAIKPAKKMFS